MIPLLLLALPLGLYDLAADQTDYDGKTLRFQGHVQIAQPLFRLEADRGIVDLDADCRPRQIALYGSVRMISSHIEGKESFAAADSFVYNLPEQTATLFCETPSKKVLFWQEGLHLSAAEIKISPSPEGGLGAIEGLGDVRFSFNLEEQDFIQNLIGKYRF